MKIQLLGFIPTIVLIILVTNMLSGGDGEKWEIVFIFIGIYTFSTLFALGLMWALS